MPKQTANEKTVKASTTRLVPSGGTKRDSLGWSSARMKACRRVGTTKGDGRAALLRGGVHAWTGQGVEWDEVETHDAP